MKKRERIIALCLAVLLGVTSIVWDFGKRTDAAQGQGAEAEVSASVKYDFESITDVSVLDEDFTAYVQGNSTADASVATNWFSGKSATGADTSQVNGLKVKKRESSTYRYLKHNDTYTNFHAIIEMYPDANTMVVVGAEPTSGGPASGNTNAFMFWFSSPTGAAWRGGGKAQATKSGFVKNTPYTLHIRVEDGTLSAWFEEINWSTSFSVGSAFTSPSHICLRQKRNYDSATSGGMNGGYKSLEIHNLDVADYTNFNYVDTTKLDAAGYKATQFDKNNNYAIVGQDQAVGTYWFTGKSKTVGSSTLTSDNAGLKPIATEANNKAQLITTPYTYEHFELSTEIHYGKNMGVVVGKKNVYPRNVSDYANFSVYFANNRIQLGGALDFDTASVTGEDSGGFSVYQTNTGIFYFDKTRTNTNPMVADRIYTLNIRKEAENLTIWVDGYDAVLTLKVAEHFEEGNVSLMAHRYNNDGGGFKSLTIKELDAPVRPPAVQAQVGQGFEKSFLPSDDTFKVSSLNREFSSYYFASSTAEAERGKVVDRWSDSDWGLRPKHNRASGARTMLTYDALLFKNVEITAKYQRNWGDYSIMIAPEGEMASIANHGIKAWVESNGKMRVTGAIDAGTATATGGYVTVLGKNMIAGYDIPDYANKATDKFYNLHVKIEGNVLYIWMDEIPEYVISVNVTDDYKGGVVSLYSNGSNDGGFGSFTAVELPATTTESTAYTQSFNTIDSLDELKDFKAYTLDSVENKPEKADIKDIFLLKNGKLQANSAANGSKDRTNFSILTLDKKEYKNFELTLKYEQARMQRYGVMFGTELGEFAYSQKGSRLTGNSGAYVYTEAEGYRNVRGSLVTSSYTQASEALYRKTGKPDSFWWYNTDVMNNVQQKTIHTMTVRVVDNAMTMIVDNDESTRVTVRLDDYEGGYISLVSDAAAGDYGAFLYLAITELGDDAQLETTLPELSDGFETMKDVDHLFDAYYLKDAQETSKLEKVNLKDRWWLTDGGFVSRTEDYEGDQYTVTADVDVLTYTKQKFTDFEMTYTYQQNWQRLGFIIGEELGQYPLNYKDGKLQANQGALYYVEAQGQSNVQGNLNNWTANDERKFRVYSAELRPDGYVDTTGQPTANIGAKKEHLVKVVVKDKQLYVFIDGNEKEAALHVFLGDDYKGGYVSLFAHAKNGYGFNHFSITDKVTTKLPKGGGTSLADNVFAADFNTTKFDTSAFKTYYLEHTKGNATGKMKEDSFENQWTLDNGVLESNTQLETPTNNTMGEYEWDDSTMVSVLTYNKKMKDFIVSYDYTKSWYRPMFMFGTELGKFALSAPNTTQHGQGVLLYPENDLGASGGLVALGGLATYTNEMRPMNRTLVKVEDYHEKGNWNSNVGTWHTMTVAVISGHCYVYLDDYGMIADYELEDYKGGYISLATSGRNYQYFSVNFDNLRITDLSDVDGTDIVSATNPKDLTVKVGTKMEDLQLPSTVQVTLKNGKKAKVDVDWKPLKYNADEEGVYQFTAVPKANNPAQIGVRLYVKVVKKLPTTNKNVKQWTFDTPQDLEDFKVTYLKNAEKGYQKSDTPNWYVNSQGKLTRDPFRAVNGDQYKEVAIFSYAGEKYTNFELEVEYTQQWQRLMVLFGSEKPGQYIDLKDIYAKTNPVAGFVEMEGTRNFIGNLKNANFDSNDKEKINNARESGIRVEDYFDEKLSGGNQGKKHTMKIRVVGDQAMMWVDNCKTPYVCTLTDYDGGYISLVTTCKSGSFDNLKITRLGATPKEEVKEQKVVANGTVNVDIDENAETKLVVPEKENTKEAVQMKTAPIVYMIGGTTILMSALIGMLFILLASKKKK